MLILYLFPAQITNILCKHIYLTHRTIGATTEVQGTRYHDNQQTIVILVQNLYMLIYNRVLQTLPVKSCLPQSLHRYILLSSNFNCSLNSACLFNLPFDMERVKLFVCLRGSVSTLSATTLREIFFIVFSIS